MSKLNLFGALAVAGMLASCGNNASEVEASTTEAQEIAAVESAVAYNIAQETANVNWIGFKTYAGSSHSGTIDIKEGSFDVENGEVVGGKFIIDMSTIKVIDLAGSEYHDKLKGHLESADFFDVSNHPETTFEITSVTPAVNAESGATHEVQGNLTMRGTTNNITFPAVIEVTDAGVSFQTPEFSINRTKWNVMYGSTGIADIVKDDMIDDYIKLTVDLDAVK